MNVLDICIEVYFYETNTFMYIANDLHATSQQTVYNDPLSDLRHQELPSDDMFRLWKAGWPHVAATRAGTTNLTFIIQSG